MDANTSLPGTIITFYSFKGGTGRSMALANVACLLGQSASSSGQRVLMMDWDLEAPGLHTFFAKPVSQPKNAKLPGVINYFIALRGLLDETNELYQQLSGEEGWKILDEVLPLKDYIVREVAPGVDLIKAGRLDEQYAAQVATFKWVHFYEQYGLAIRAFRKLLAAKYGYCLIDSRTGLTDVSGICTMLLPEKLVTVFTPNRQSLDGIVDLVRQAIEYRRSSDDLRPLAVFPLPSRIELAEKDLRDKWLNDYQGTFEALFREVYEVAECDLTAYFNEVQLPHESFYAYGENIAVLHEERSHALSLKRQYEIFTQRLIALNYAWEPRTRVESTEFPSYLDYEIRIQSREGDTFPLLISAPGGEVGWPFRLPTSDPIYQEAAQRLATLRTDEKTLEQIGQVLFNTLFKGAVKDVFKRSQGLLREGQGLRIRLTIAPTEYEVADLPWEFLYDPDQGPLALLDMPIMRYLPQSALIPQLRTELPIKVLLTAAQTPSENGVERELHAVQEALARLGEHLHMVVEPHLTPSKLQKLLRESFHVWHFVGHGIGGEAGTTSVLYFEDVDGDVQPISAAQLSIMLNRSDVRLVVLDNCDSPQLATAPFRSMAPALIRAQVPAVVTTQFTDPAHATPVFVEAFYRALIEGFPIDAAVNEGRKAVMRETGLDKPDWGLPVVYTRVPDGKLFALPELISST